MSQQELLSSESEEEMDCSQYSYNPVEYLLSSIPKDVSDQTFRKLIIQKNYCQMFFLLGMKHQNSKISFMELETLREKQNVYLSDLQLTECE